MYKHSRALDSLFDHILEIFNMSTGLVSITCFNSKKNVL